jgi:hypothetical protein
MRFSDDFVTNTPCRELKKLSVQDIDEIASQVVYIYRQRGFPYYSLSDTEIYKIVTSLKEFDIHNLELPNNELQQNMLGLNLVNMFHPQMWEVQCGNSKTPKQVFDSDILFKNAILKRIKYSDTKLQPFNIRKSLKAFGSQSVSNFRPTIAKWVCERYGNGGEVLDPCSGYSGRLLGALTSNVTQYIGIDPDYRQVNGGNSLIAKLNTIGLVESSGVILQNAFEDTPIDKESYDLVFTSPPYYNKEKYSYDDTQSWIRYPTISEWIQNFLYPLVDKSMIGLRHGGYLVLNVGDFLLDPLYTRLGIPTEVWNMRLSKMIGSRNPTKQETHKIEKLLVWRKQ